MDSQTPLSVSQALQLAKQALEGLSIRITGEISELSDRPGYKAVYFTLADESAALPCLIWNNAYAQIGFKLERGMQVELRGRFGLYAPKGRMNFVATSITLAGEGALRLRVDELARKLEAEGLMDVARRRPLPVLPQRIGLVTSPRGKAVHDVLRTLRRRFPLAEVYLAGVTVEGALAANAMAEALKAANDSGAELILLVRGGGSYEDLMPFNDEGLARSIVASRAPVVTGIGHEPDTTIADMVADLRASTPTAAAESVVPDIQELRIWLRNLGQNQSERLNTQLSGAAMRLKSLASRPVLRSPQSLYFALSVNLEQSALRIQQALPATIQSDRERLLRAAVSLRHRGPILIREWQQDLLRLRGRLAAPPHALEFAASDIALRAAQLEGLSPLSVLARGYAVAYDQSGTVLSSIQSVQSGDSVRIRLKDGNLYTAVEAIQKAELTASNE